MKNSVVQMNTNAGSLMHDYSKIDKCFQTYSPQELTKDFHRLHAGLADILAQVVECTYEYGEYHFLLRQEATEGIYRLTNFFEVLADLNEVGGSSNHEGNYCGPHCKLKGIQIMNLRDQVKRSVVLAESYERQLTKSGTQVQIDRDWLFVEIEKVLHIPQDEMKAIAENYE